MPVAAQREFRLSRLAISICLIAICVMLGAMVFYLRKKANDEMILMFQLQDRMDRIEMQLQKEHQKKIEPTSDVSN